MANSLQLSSSPSTLRAAFGDRKLPDISRKITACVACRKLKIKCLMPDSGPPCKRCEKRELSCTVNRSLQQVLESDLSWKDSIESRLVFLENSFAQHAGNTVPQSEAHDSAAVPSIVSPTEDVRETSLALDQQRWEVVVDNGHMAAIPASYISEVNPPTQKRRHSAQDASKDMIGIGILHKNDATSLFELYRDTLDQFLYAILGDHKSLSDVRNASPLLTDAICTVAALHIKSANYAACRASFKQQISALIFSKRLTVDDVRGLCIGAFWLSDLSWALNGLAVRIANEINLNRAFSRPNYADRSWYLDARLYLLVHVCDRHLSIVYGRAPMSETFHNINVFGDFLESEHASENDKRLVSQLEIWSISYRTYKVFGLDSEGALPDTYTTDFRRINIALDTWRADWDEKLAQVDSRPGTSLHYEFAKLYLCSHAYRGFLHSQEHALSTDTDLEEFAIKAVSAAESILSTINNDCGMRTQLQGLPTYFDTMIAFAVVFLLKVCAKAPSWLPRDKSVIMTLLENTAITLQSITSDMRTEHILSSITRSVRKLIEKASTGMLAQATQDNTQLSAGPPSTTLDLPWLMSPDDSIFLNNFNLTGPAQDIDFNFLDFSTQY